MFATLSQPLMMVVSKLLDMIPLGNKAGSGSGIGNHRNYNARRSTDSSTNSIKRFICRSKAPPEGMSRFHLYFRVHGYVCLCVCARARAVLVEEERESEKDERTFQPIPRRVVASRNNTMLLMLRLQFRHNFLSRSLESGVGKLPGSYRMPGLL